MYESILVCHFHPVLFFSTSLSLSFFIRFKYLMSTNFPLKPIQAARYSCHFSRTSLSRTCKQNYNGIRTENIVCNFRVTLFNVYYVFFYLFVFCKLSMLVLLLVVFFLSIFLVILLRNFSFPLDPIPDHRWSTNLSKTQFNSVNITRLFAQYQFSDVVFFSFFVKHYNSVCLMCSILSSGNIFIIENCVSILFFFSSVTFLYLPHYHWQQKKRVMQKNPRI